jgi:hypothetical protein
MSRAGAFDSRPYLILCEGETDKRFIDQLITARDITKDFQVRFPSRGTDNSGGRSKFGSWLDLAKEIPGWENIKGILIVSDNDDDVAGSFQEVRASLADAPGFPIPDAEREVATVVGFPPLVVYMLPTGTIGSLETLCLDAAYRKWPEIKTPLDHYVNAMNINAWPLINRRSKMKLQTVIATTCLPRPDAGFSGHWREDDQYHLPLQDFAFDDLEFFLEGFRQLINPAPVLA